MSQLDYIISLINNWVWGAPLIILILSIGIYLTIRTRAIQFRYLWYAHRLAFTRHDDRAKGDISHFQALMTALAATIGTGSITGVATAIAIGGLGSLFWMWIAALVGMALKYSEAILAIKYRVIDAKGEMCGGPMYYLAKARLKWLAILFALFGGIAAFGIGNMVQANSAALAISALFPVSPIWTGIALMILTGWTLFGGIKSIGRAAAILVPIMAIFYLVGGLLIIALQFKAIPGAFVLIFKSAFEGAAPIGGFAGASVMMALQLGMSRGIFSSEAGLGSSSIAAAAAKTDVPGRQALVSMCSVFITTGIVCTITGLVIATSGVLGEIGSDGHVLDGSAFAMRAFDHIFPYGGLIIAIALIPFAYSTILGWAYYGEKCIEYLFGIKGVQPYRLTFTLLILPGSILSLQFVWNISTILNGLMAFPNLVGLLVLSGIVAKESRAFERLLKKERLMRRK